MLLRMALVKISLGVGPRAGTDGRARVHVTAT